MTISLRAAVADDLPAIRSLDAVAFPPGRPDREPSHPGELEGGLERGQITLAEEDGVVLGMLQAERTAPDQLYLASLAVAPEAQGRGIGRMLVERLLAVHAEMEPRPALFTVTSPLNVPMIGLLTSLGFVVVRGLRDYFGPGKHRVYCRYREHHPVIAPSDRTLVPVDAVDTVFELLEHDEHEVTAVRRSVQGDFFEVSRDRGDDQGLMADEASISVSESGAVLAALTFLLGFSFAIPSYSEELRILVLVATILTAGSVQIYANASGALARIRDGGFASYMKWGNLLLEFGGLYPLVIVLPAVFAQASDNPGLSITTGAIVGAAIVAYELSPFSVTARYGRGVVFAALVTLSALLPVAAAPLVLLTGRDGLWVLLVAGVMALRVLWLAPASKAEIGRRIRPRWRTRRTR